ncbi:MAG: nucleotidyltransferase [Candidatus Aminicenantes bacterium]|nr:nucleotidyltransferase [Candidatus Aminicenantes bacterium]
MKVEKDYEEFLRLLNKHNVKYCIIGAFAVAFYARPRYTKDIDILIEPSRKNAQRILNALEEFGFGELEITQGDLTCEGSILQLGYEPIRIDLLTKLEGMQFRQIWHNKVIGDYGSQKVYFIGLEDLIRNKKKSSRLSDRVDISILEKARKKS